MIPSTSSNSPIPSSCAASAQMRHEEAGQFDTSPGHFVTPRRPSDWHPKQRIGYPGIAGASFRCHLGKLVVITQGGMVMHQRRFEAMRTVKELIGVTGRVYRRKDGVKMGSCPCARGAACSATKHSSWSDE